MVDNPYVLLYPLLDQSGDVVLDDSNREIEGRLYSDILAKFFEGVKQDFNVIERLYDNEKSETTEEYSTKKILDSKGRPIITNGRFDYIFIEGWYY